MGPRFDGVGLDLGSTTAKVVAARDGEVVLRAYRRHRGRLLDEARALIAQAEAAVGPGAPRFVTGSAGSSLAETLGGAYVHEVHAVVAAVRATLPGARTVIELGGQDAKMVHLDEAGGVESEMNERCAAGTGATLDRCVHRLGLDESALAELVPGEHLPAVSAKCGVFAETDLVNLVKAGLSQSVVLAALLDAIVRGNLAVLARGRPLVPRVVLLGGPHAFIPALAPLWRRRLAERWRQRGMAAAAPGDVVVPAHAEYFGALGALASAGVLERLAVARSGAGGRAPRLGLARSPDARRRERPGLRPPEGSIDEVLARHACPVSPSRAPRQRLFLGVDAGSTTLKAVVVDEEDLPVVRAYRRAGGNPLDEVAPLLAEVAGALGPRASRVVGLGVTGYAAALLGPVLGADASPVETLAHARGARRFVPDADVVCDVGGQDIKVLLLDDAGGVRGFHLSSQCAAGNGALLEAAAADLGVDMEGYAAVALSARRAPAFSVGCAVFLDTERVSAQRSGYTPAEILAGMAAVLPRNVWENVVAAPSLPALGRVFVLSGGVQRNAAAVKAQVDYLGERHPSARVVIHPFPGEAGALGAALAAREACAHRPSRFVGFERAAHTRWTARSDEHTVCRRCPGHCSRTVVRAAGEGRDACFVTGHGCERGADLEHREPDRRGRGAFTDGARNLLRVEAARLFAAPTTPAVSSAGRGLRIAVPRVLALYRSAPLLLHYLAAIGVPPDAIITGGATSEALWRRAAGRGTVDACFPVKVVQAHVADLLARRAESPFDVLFYPVLTHAVTAVTGCADTASCPVVAGTPLVTRAAFGADAGGRLPDGTLLLTPRLVLTDPGQLRASLLAAIRRVAPSLTEPEHDAALAAARAAQREFEERMEHDGIAAIARAAATGRAAVVLLARPYHVDPGLHHEIGSELAALGRTVLSVRALPRRPEALAALGLPPLRLDGDAAALTNSGDGEKLAAAAAVAAHPFLVAIELSSFKCGQDASLYGAVAARASTGGKPFLALHDLDETRPAASLRLRLRTFLDAVERWEHAVARQATRLGEAL